MNRNEHLIVILAEEGAEIAKEASLLVDRLNNVQHCNAVTGDLGEAFKPLLDEYADFIGTMNKIFGKPVAFDAIAMRKEHAAKDIGEQGRDATGSEIDKLNRLLAQIGGDALTVAIRASKAVRFGMEEVQPEQVIPYSNEKRLLSACADLIGIVEYTAKRYNIEFAGDEFQTRILAKGGKIEKFLAYSAECGTLQG